MVMLDVFPAIYSTLAPQALIEGVLTQYPLGIIEQCLFWHRGLSDIYLVKTQTQDYILKISHHHWRSQSDVQFELEFLDFLHQQDIPVAYPFKTKQGNLYVTIHALEGDRYAALFPFAPGEVPLGDLNPTQSTIFGETLAKLHQASLKFQNQTPRHPLDCQYLLDKSQTIIVPCLKNNYQNIVYLDQAIAEIKQELKHLPQEAPYWGVCWGDPHSGNVHFTLDNQVTLFDFDQCGYGWRAFDLAKFLQVSLNAGVSSKIREAFFSGYQNIQSLSEIESKSLQALTKMAHIWAWAISINAAAIHNWSRLDDCYCTRRIQRLKRLSTKDWQLF